MKQLINALINQYLEAHSLAWAPSTLKSERARLNAVGAHLTGAPRELWDALEAKGAAPYARCTVWARVVDFYDWCIERNLLPGPNQYRAFRKEHQRLFKNAYQRQVPQITFDEAERRISTLAEPHRSKARDLLYGGLRYAESFTYNAGTVTGKGGKVRRAYLPNASPATYTKSYYSLRRALATLGLKVHDLRKLAATRMVQLGASEFELTEAFGWSDIRTASSYVRAQQSKVSGLFKAMKGKK